MSNTKENERNIRKGDKSANSPLKTTASSHSNGIQKSIEKITQGKGKMNDSKNSVTTLSIGNLNQSSQQGHLALARKGRTQPTKMESFPPPTVLSDNKDKNNQKCETELGSKPLIKTSILEAVHRENIQAGTSLKGKGIQQQVLQEWTQVFGDGVNAVHNKSVKPSASSSDIKINSDTTSTKNVSMVSSGKSNTSLKSRAKSEPRKRTTDRKVKEARHDLDEFISSKNEKKQHVGSMGENRNEEIQQNNMSSFKSQRGVSPNKTHPNIPPEKIQSNTSPMKGKQTMSPKKSKQNVPPPKQLQQSVPTVIIQHTKPPTNSQQNVSPKKIQDNILPTIIQKNTPTSVAQKRVTPTTNQQNVSPKKPQPNLSPKKLQPNLSPKKLQLNLSPKKIQQDSSISPAKTQENIATPISKQDVPHKKMQHNVSPKKVQDILPTIIEEETPILMAQKRISPVKKQQNVSPKKLQPNVSPKKVQQERIPPATTQENIATPIIKLDIPIKKIQHVSPKQLQQDDIPKATIKQMASAIVLQNSSPKKSQHNISPKKQQQEMTLLPIKTQQYVSPKKSQQYVSPKKQSESQIKRIQISDITEKKSDFTPNGVSVKDISHELPVFENFPSSHDIKVYNDQPKKGYQTDTKMQIPKISPSPNKKPDEIKRGRIERKINEAPVLNKISPSKLINKGFEPVKEYDNVAECASNNDKTLSTGQLSSPAKTKQNLPPKTIEIKKDHRVYEPIHIEKPLVTHQSAIFEQKSRADNHFKCANGQTLPTEKKDKGMHRQASSEELRYDNTDDKMPQNNHTSTIKKLPVTTNKTLTILNSEIKNSVAKEHNGVRPQNCELPINEQSRQTSTINEISAVHESMKGDSKNDNNIKQEQFQETVDVTNQSPGKYKHKTGHHANLNHDLQRLETQCLNIDMSPNRGTSNKKKKDRTGTLEEGSKKSKNKKKHAKTVHSYTRPVPDEKNISDWGLPIEKDNEEYNRVSKSGFEINSSNTMSTTDTSKDFFEHEKESKKKPIMDALSQGLLSSMMHVTVASMTDEGNANKMNVQELTHNKQAKNKKGSRVDSLSPVTCSRNTSECHREAKQPKSPSENACGCHREEKKPTSPSKKTCGCHREGKQSTSPAENTPECHQEEKQSASPSRKKRKSCERPVKSPAPECQPPPEPEPEQCECPDESPGYSQPVSIRVVGQQKAAKKKKKKSVRPSQSKSTHSFSSRCEEPESKQKRSKSQDSICGRKSRSRCTPRCDDDACPGAIRAERDSHLGRICTTDRPSDYYRGVFGRISSAFGGQLQYIACNRGRFRVPGGLGFYQLDSTTTGWVELAARCCEELALDSETSTCHSSETLTECMRRKEARKRIDRDNDTDDTTGQAEQIAQDERSFRAHKAGKSDKRTDTPKEKRQKCDKKKKTKNQELKTTHLEETTRQNTSSIPGINQSVIDEIKKRNSQVIHKNTHAVGDEVINDDFDKRVASQYLSGDRKTVDSMSQRQIIDEEMRKESQSTNIISNIPDNDSTALPPHYMRTSSKGIAPSMILHLNKSSVPNGVPLENEEMHFPNPTRRESTDINRPNSYIPNSIYKNPNDFPMNYESVNDQRQDRYSKTTSQCGDERNGERAAECEIGSETINARQFSTDIKKPNSNTPSNAFESYNDFSIKYGSVNDQRPDSYSKTTSYGGNERHGESEIGNPFESSRDYSMKYGSVNDQWENKYNKTTKSYGGDEMHGGRAADSEIGTDTVNAREYSYLSGASPLSAFINPEDKSPGIDDTHSECSSPCRLSTNTGDGTEERFMSEMKMRLMSSEQRMERQKESLKANKSPTMNSSSFLSFPNVRSGKDSTTYDDMHYNKHSTRSNGRMSFENDKAASFNGKLGQNYYRPEYYHQTDSPTRNYCGTQGNFGMDRENRLEDFKTSLRNRPHSFEHHRRYTGQRTFSPEKSCSTISRSPNPCPDNCIRFSSDMLVNDAARDMEHARQCKKDTIPNSIRAQRNARQESLNKFYNAKQVPKTGDIKYDRRHRCPNSPDVDDVRYGTKSNKYRSNSSDRRMRSVKEPTEHSRDYRTVENHGCGKKLGHGTEYDRINKCTRRLYPDSDWRNSKTTRNASSLDGRFDSLPTFPNQTGQPTLSSQSRTITEVSSLFDTESLPTTRHQSVSRKTCTKYVDTDDVTTESEYCAQSNVVYSRLSTESKPTDNCRRRRIKSLSRSCHESRSDLDHTLECVDSCHSSDSSETCSSDTEIHSYQRRYSETSSNFPDGGDNDSKSSKRKLRGRIIIRQLGGKPKCPEFTFQSFNVKRQQKKIEPLDSQTESNCSSFISNAVRNKTCNRIHPLLGGPNNQFHIKRSRTAMPEIRYREPQHKAMDSSRTVDKCRTLTLSNKSEFFTNGSKMKATAREGSKPTITTNAETLKSRQSHHQKIDCFQQVITPEQPTTKMNMDPDMPIYGHHDDNEWYGKRNNSTIVFSEDMAASISRAKVQADYDEACSFQEYIFMDDLGGEIQKPGRQVQLSMFSRDVSVLDTETDDISTTNSIAILLSDKNASSNVDNNHSASAGLEERNPCLDYNKSNFRKTLPILNPKITSISKRETCKNSNNQDHFQPLKVTSTMNKNISNETQKHIKLNATDSKVVYERIRQNSLRALSFASTMTNWSYSEPEIPAVDFQNSGTASLNEDSKNRDKDDMSRKINSLFFKFFNDEHVPQLDLKSPFSLKETTYAHVSDNSNSDPHDLDKCVNKTEATEIRCNTPIASKSCDSFLTPSSLPISTGDTGQQSCIDKSLNLDDTISHNSFISTMKNESHLNDQNHIPVCDVESKCEKDIASTTKDLDSEKTKMNAQFREAFFIRKNTKTLFSPVKLIVQSKPHSSGISLDGNIHSSSCEIKGSDETSSSSSSQISTCDICEPRALDEGPSSHPPPITESIDINTGIQNIDASNFAAANMMPDICLTKFCVCNHCSPQTVVDIVSQNEREFKVPELQFSVSTQCCLHQNETKELDDVPTCPENVDKKDAISHQQDNNLVNDTPRSSSTDEENNENNEDSLIVWMKCMLMKELKNMASRFHRKDKKVIRKSAFRGSSIDFVSKSPSDRLRSSVIKFEHDDMDDSCSNSDDDNLSCDHIEEEDVVDHERNISYKPHKCNRHQSQSHRCSGGGSWIDVVKGIQGRAKFKKYIRCARKRKKQQMQDFYSNGLFRQSVKSRSQSCLEAINNQSLSTIIEESPNSDSADSDIQDNGKQMSYTRLIKERYKHNGNTPLKSMIMTTHESVFSPSRPKYLSKGQAHRRFRSTRSMPVRKASGMNLKDLFCGINSASNNSHFARSSVTAVREENMSIKESLASIFQPRAYKSSYMRNKESLNKYKADIFESLSKSEASAENFIDTYLSTGPRSMNRKIIQRSTTRDTSLNSTSGSALSRRIPAINDFTNNSLHKARIDKYDNNINTDAYLTKYISSPQTYSLGNDIPSPNLRKESITAENYSNRWWWKKDNDVSNHTSDLLTRNSENTYQNYCDMLEMNTLSPYRDWNQSANNGLENLSPSDTLSISSSESSDYDDDNDDDDDEDDDDDDVDEEVEDDNDMVIEKAPVCGFVHSKNMANHGISRSDAVLDLPSMCKMEVTNREKMLPFLFNPLHYNMKKTRINEPLSEPVYKPTDACKKELQFAEFACKNMNSSGNIFTRSSSDNDFDDGNEGDDEVYHSAEEDNMTPYMRRVSVKESWVPGCSCYRVANVCNHRQFSLSDESTKHCRILHGDCGCFTNHCQGDKRELKAKHYCRAQHHPDALSNTNEAVCFSNNRSEQEERNGNFPFYKAFAEKCQDVPKTFQMSKYSVNKNKPNNVKDFVNWYFKDDENDARHGNTISKNESIALPSYTSEKKCERQIKSTYTNTTHSLENDHGATGDVKTIGGKGDKDAYIPEVDKQYKEAVRYDLSSTGDNTDDSSDDCESVEHLGSKMLSGVMYKRLNERMCNNSLQETKAKTSIEKARKPKPQVKRPVSKFKRARIVVKSNKESSATRKKRNWKSNNDDVSESTSLENIQVQQVEKERVRFACDRNREWAEIGRGSYGCVYLGLLDGKVEVAIKDFYESNSYDQVIHEARMLVFLEDTGITPKFYGLRRRFDVTKQPGEYCIIMEYFGEGKTLFNVLSDKTELTCYEWIDVIGQLVAGLRLIHRRNVLLNDLKADNILIDLNGERKTIRYIDVGMATYKQGLTFQLPQNQMGKYNFLAPEVRDGLHTSKRSDIYSLGYMLDQILRVAGEELSGLEVLVSRCMEEDPKKRPSVDEIVARVHNFINSSSFTKSKSAKKKVPLSNSV